MLNGVEGEMFGRGHMLTGPPINSSSSSRTVLKTPTPGLDPNVEESVGRYALTTSERPSPSTSDAKTRTAPPGEEKSEVLHVGHNETFTAEKAMSSTGHIN